MPNLYHIKASILNTGYAYSSMKNNKWYLLRKKIYFYLFI